MSLLRGKRSKSEAQISRVFPTEIQRAQPSFDQEIIYYITTFDNTAELHPIFYGCFDWHSSVHGHWLLARAAQIFPNTELAQNITAGQSPLSLCAERPSMVKFS